MKLQRRGRLKLKTSHEGKEAVDWRAKEAAAKEEKSRKIS